MPVLLSPRADFVFKRIFGNESAPEILISFLNAVLKPVHPIVSVVIKNPEIGPEYIKQKHSCLDVLATTSNEELVNIEIQNKNQHNMTSRSLYYWGKKYTSQLEEGEDYDHLMRTICINILNFSHLPDPDYHNIFQFLNTKHYNPLTDHAEIHFIELSKIRQFQENDPLERWLEFIKTPDRSVSKDPLDPSMEHATRILQKMSCTPEERALYDLWQKNTLDESSAISRATREGLEQGLEQGREEGLEQGLEQGREEGLEQGREDEKLEIAKNLLDILDNETIALKTGLSLAQIQKLR